MTNLFTDLLSRNGLIIDNNDKFYYLNGQLHREDGPAVEAENGYKAWFQHGDFHRLDGPARMWSDGAKQWWYKGQYIECDSQVEFEKMIKLLIFA